MPRPSPPTREAVELNIKPLPGMMQRRIAEVLGLAALPDYLAILIARMIATHHLSRKLVKGDPRRPWTAHRPAKWAAALRQVENRMRRGHDGPEITRVITDLHFCTDDETWTRLAPIVADPGVPRDAKLKAIEARRHELEALPRINPRHARRVELATYALEQIWYSHAVRRDDRARQWKFVLLILEAAGEGTPGHGEGPSGLRQHPERLKRDIGRLLELTSQP